MVADNKVAKHVTFDEEDNSKSETIRNFYMMETPKEEVKPNFLLGEDEDVEEKEDEFPSSMANGVLQKQLSDAALMDKRRRLR